MSIIDSYKILEMIQYFWWKIDIEFYLTSYLFALTVCIVSIELNL